MISEATDSTTDPELTILDTARAVFETYGVRRANIEDVAARAGVSRSTIYRRFPSKDDLFEQVVRREAESFFLTLDQATAGCHPQKAVIEAFALGVRLVHDSPLFSRIVESEPELFGLFSRSRRLPDWPIRRRDRPHPAPMRGRHPRAPTWPTSPTSCCASRLASSCFPPTASIRRIAAAVRDYAARYLVPIIDGTAR